MRKIQWRKWIDPMKKELDKLEEDRLYSDVPYRSRGELGPGVITPLGVFPFQEDVCPGNLFNFWMGETNFIFTKGMRRHVSRLPGIEALDVYTPYRFRIAVGKQFEQGTVMRSIDELFVEKPPLPSPANVNHLYQMLSLRYPQWALVRSNGATDVVSGETVEEVEGKIPPGSEKVSASYPG